MGVLRARWEKLWSTKPHQPRADPCGTHPRSFKELSWGVRLPRPGLKVKATRAHHVLYLLNYTGNEKVTSKNTKDTMFSVSGSQGVVPEPAAASLKT